MKLYSHLILCFPFTGHCVHMRGLPFEATTKDVNNFFAPLNPVDIRIIYDQNTGRAKGECDVDFSTHADAEAAMQKDKQNIGECFYENFARRKEWAQLENYITTS